MNKKMGVIFRLAVIWVAGICGAAAYAGDSARNDSNYFTNEDLEKYKGQHENTMAEQSEPPKQERAARNREDREKEYWCKKASPYARKIDGLKEDLRLAEQRVSDSQTKSARKKSTALHSKMENSRRKLKEAQRDLEELENEAYRKGVPQGWLRCQFE